MVDMLWDEDAQKEMLDRLPVEKQAAMRELMKLQIETTKKFVHPMLQHLDSYRQNLLANGGDPASVEELLKAMFLVIGSQVVMAHPDITMEDVKKDFPSYFEQRKEIRKKHGLR